MLSLVTFPASLLHMRQIPQPRGRVYWIGVVLNGLLFVASAYALVALQLTGELL